MAILSVEARNDASIRLPTANSGVCHCGAVYDYGNVVVPVEYRGMCGRCAARRGM
jgi:hypothetical protein